MKHLGSAYLSTKAEIEAASPTLDTAEREMVKPVEAVARVLDPTIWQRWDEWVEWKGLTASEAAEQYAEARDLTESRSQAIAALDYLTSHGFLTLPAIVAIQAEKKGAGE